MKKKGKYLAVFGLLLSALLLFPALPAEAAKTVYNSPYVTFSPDGRAWTTNAGDRNVRWYPEGDTVSTGIGSSLRALAAGEHYYSKPKTGIVPVGCWRVEWSEGQCIHSMYPPDEGGAAVTQYHGVPFEREVCLARHYSGWCAYCADCGEKVTRGLIYMSREAAESLEYLQLSADVEHMWYYYYLCPFCNNLEQGYDLNAHDCKAISANRYRVKYEMNPTGVNYGSEGGYMEDSIHMYNNSTLYEGVTVTPVKNLSDNGYRRTGYIFTGWNTKPDGSGSSYADGAEILNLTTENWSGEDGDMTGTIVLYAQWAESESTLRIDPNGGSYAGNSRITAITQKYKTTYAVDRSLVSAPAGYRVSFQCNGGNPLSDTMSGMYFTEWSMVSPFEGKYSASRNLYQFSASNAHTDTLRAAYAPDSITLPRPVRPGYSFGGWYYDAAFQYPAGGAGDSITPANDLTLYAQWVELVLHSTDNYSAYGGSGAVDLSWRQPDGQGKTYLLYQSPDPGMAGAKRINAVDDIGSTLNVSRDFGRTGHAEEYTVPYSGIYTLGISGAQGSDYDGCAGGKGGSVALKVWLVKGEKLTVTVGGKDGYNGGGTGNLFGNGGGKTTVYSDRRGILAVAGGGGAASAMGDGGAGGSEASLAADGNGGSGAAGGGGGYSGGNAGELIIHNHVSGCEVRHSHTDSCYQITTHVHQEGVCSTRRIPAYCGGCHWDSSENSWVYGWCPNCGRDESSGCPAGGTCVGEATAFDCDKTEDVSLTCGKAEGEIEGYTCGRSEGEVISSRPAYGGSSYVNRTAVLSSAMTSGDRAGDGAVTLRSEAVGYTEEHEMKKVKAADLAAPDAVDAGCVEQQPAGTGQITVTWHKPSDNGTDYYHQAETYLQGSTALLCRSNITKNTLVSGVKGYYYVIDAQPGTGAGSGAAFMQAASDAAILTVDVREWVQYLHLAVVDVAGNVSATTHIRIDAGSVRWKVYTRQLQIGSGENVFAAAEPKTYFVRCDGSTPVHLTNSAYMDGQPTADYQLNYTLYQTAIRGRSDGSGENRIYTPSAADIAQDAEIRADRLRYAVSGTTPLKLYPYSLTRRSDRGRNLEAEQKFTLNRSAHGKYIDIVPGAGAVYRKAGGEEIYYSDASGDAVNGITLIGDCAGPEITGLEVLENREPIIRTEETVTLSVTASDALSGVADFYLKITNRDNFSEQCFYPEGGVITLDITQAEPLFTGDFTVTGYAVDHVGNATEIEYEITEFALEARIERILEPHDPVFKRGESGILYVTTYGYADRVEVTFPEAMQELDERLKNTIVFTYDRADREYRQEEEVQFMIPLYDLPDGDYRITVRAYKQTAVAEDRPVMRVTSEGGSVLDEFRTRLR